MNQEIQSVLSGEKQEYVVCGDCLEILPTLLDGCVDLVCTDPPYGIDYQSTRRTDRSQWKPKIANDKTPCLEWLPMAGGGRLVCFCRWDVEADFVMAIREAGYDIKSQVIWDKMIHGMGDLEGEFAPQHENIVYATKQRWTWPGSRPKSILRFQRVMPECLVHPNEKPVELLCELISCLSITGDLVLDPFCGSGTTCVAAKMLGRRYIGIEISPEYCEIARQRLEAVDTGVPVKEARAGQLPLFGPPMKQGVEPRDPTPRQ